MNSLFKRTVGHRRRRRRRPRIADIPDRLGRSPTNLENRERLHFPVSSQISAMAGDNPRQMKAQICTVGDVGDDFQSPYHTFVYTFQFLVHFPFSAKFKIGRIWARLLVIDRYIGKIWDGQQKVKSPIAWDFPDI